MMKTKTNKKNPLYIYKPKRLGVAKSIVSLIDIYALKKTWDSTPKVPKDH